MKERLDLARIERRPIPNDRFLLDLNELFPETPTGLRKEDALRPPFTAAGQKTVRFHGIDQLRDIALGHQERIGELLLGTPFNRAGMIDHVEPADGNPVLTHGLGGASVDLLVDPGQPHPRHDNRVDSPPLGAPYACAVVPSRHGFRHGYPFIAHCMV